MNSFSDFEKICRAMSNSDAYPHEVLDIQRRDTHISAVFLTGQWVYKLKKPVMFDFLDFRFLDDRKRFCEQEVLLNQRLSKGIYQGVAAIYQNEAGRISLEPVGRVVEYAVKMVQLPDSENLGHLLLKKSVSSDQMDSLGRILADFYLKTDRTVHIDAYGRHQAIAYNMEENFREIEPFVDVLLDGRRWEFIRQVSRAFLADHHHFFEHRIETGRIRDGHGDLKVDHIYFHDGIQIIDCIEFNDRFRYGDCALDLSFLHMDLVRLGFSHLAGTLLSAYALAAKDPQIYALIDFYSAYRAVVRLKIACFSHGAADQPHKQALEREIAVFMDQAYRYVILFGRPTLWLFFGLPATGKSTLAKQAADAMRTPLFRSDMVRKKDTSRNGTKIAAYNAGAYRSAMRNLVYGQLMALAQEKLKGGRSVMLDATFSRTKWREAARQLAADLDVDLIFVECECGRETMIHRLEARETVPGDSDARLIHMEQLIADFEPFEPEDPGTHIKADTEQPLDTLLVELLGSAHALKTGQVKSRIGLNFSKSVRLRP